MGAGAWVDQEAADLLRGLRREDVLELAGRLLDLGFVIEMQGFSKKPFRQTMAADDVLGPLPAPVGELNDGAAVLGHDVGRMNGFVAAVKV